MALRKVHLPKRNELCPCQSGRKFKKCCGSVLISRPSLQHVDPEYIDYGEAAVRWVIVDSSGTKIFSDIDNRAIVFCTRDDAYAVTRLEEFADQDSGEINVAGVGPTKWEALQNRISFVEVLDAETATRLVRERITRKRQSLEAEAKEPEAEKLDNAE